MQLQYKWNFIQSPDLCQTGSSEVYEHRNYIGLEPENCIHSFMLSQALCLPPRLIYIMSFLHFAKKIHASFNMGVHLAVEI